MTSLPIGIFDSGLGGLSVLRQVQRLLPAESVIYLADTANVPYGDKPVPIVRELALRLTEELVRLKCKCVLMASGTSTVAGLEAAQAQFPTVSVLGTIEGGARAAVAATDGPIGVLATNATVQSRAFTQAVQALVPGRRVVEVGCPRFVPLVETGQASEADALDASRQYLSPLLVSGVEAVILGCTHFPFLLPALEQVAADADARILFVDPAAEAVREAAVVLKTRGLLAPADHDPLLTFAATGDPEDFRRYASALLGCELSPVSHLDL